MMPSADLLQKFADDLQVTCEWRWNGQDYALTALAWLENLDRNRNQVLPILQETYGRAHAERWLQRWRMFFLAVAELFAFRDGHEWFVGHYLLSHVSATKRAAAVLA
jgi:cyclopropane-fatty-acyl-phospholipid synthase